MQEAQVRGQDSGNGNGRRLRSPPLALFSQAFDDLEHLLAPTVGIDELVRHAHADLFPSIGREQSLDEEVAHEDADEDAAVGAVFLLR